VRSCCVKLNFRFYSPEKSKLETGYDTPVYKLKALAGWNDASGFDNSPAAEMSILTTASRKVVQPNQIM
jgi:hypothetical protein